jgi:serine/threonine protein kinase
VKFSDVSIAHISSIFRKSPIQQTSYLPPESLEYAVGDWQTDIWSLGIIYLEMLLNRHIEVSEATLEEVSKLIGSIPHKGIQVLLGGMCTVRNRRFTIEEVIKVVNRIRNDPEVESEEEES